jgi:hypothetical protein
MVGCIPTLLSEIHAADEGHGVIDHDDFLVVRSTDRMPTIEVKMKVSMALPAKSIDRQDFAARRIKHRKVPIQNVDFQPSAGFDQCFQKISELDRKSIADAVLNQFGSAVDVPADDEYRTLSTDRRRSQCRKIRRAIDQERNPTSAGTAPAIASWLQYAARAAPMGIEISHSFDIP